MASYEYYFKALAGLSPSPHLNQIELGFYRMELTRNGRKVLDPIAVFPIGEDYAGVIHPTEERGIGVVRGMPPRDWPLEEAISNWPWFCMNVVKEDDCRAAFETGEWPDQAAGLGHNMPPSLSQDPIARAEHIMGAAGPFLNGPLSDKASADAAAHVVKELQNVAGDLRTARDEVCVAFERFAKQRGEPFIKARQQVEATAKQIKPKIGTFMASVGLARVGLKGHAVVRRTRAKIVVTEPLLILARYRDHPEVVALAEKLAREEVRTGQKHPGAHVQEVVSYE